MRTHDSTAVECTDSPTDRDVRALTACLSVLPDYGRAADAPGLYVVVSDSGREYLVDAHEGACECPDHEYRGVECKHLRRVAYATGEKPVPASVDGVDDQLGAHVDGEPTRAATDGGAVATVRERTRVPVAGGVLVYEDRDLGRELVGFEDVDDWSDLRTALATRGHGVGAIHHLPELDAGEEEDY